jgi:hypothetical protein
MIVTKVVLLGLNKLLKLNASGNEQDWDIELADYKRVTEFIEIADSANLSLPERYAIVELILASYDDYLTNEGNDEGIWKGIVKVLDAHFELYVDTLNYWALTQETTVNNIFEITPQARAYLASKNDFFI